MICVLRMRLSMFFSPALSAATRALDTRPRLSSSGLGSGPQSRGCPVGDDEFSRPVGSSPVCLSVSGQFGASNLLPVSSVTQLSGERMQYRSEARAKSFNPRTRPPPRRVGGVLTGLCCGPLSRR